MINAIGIFFAALFSGMLGWFVWENRARDQGEKEGLRYLSFLGGINLPVLLAILLVTSSFYYGLTESAALVASTFFGAFLHICVYNMLLLLLLPLLRRWISARACACLWMLPNILYLSQAGYMSRNRPAWVITLPDRVLKLLSILWLGGFAVIFLYKCLEHLVFRRRVLREAQPVRDEAVLDLWRQEQANAGLAKTNYKLVQSPAVRTPLSIGLFKLTTRVILPDTTYEPEELRMIFRHELVHICRSDAWSKLSLIFCTAICWFNPFMWISMGKSFDDMELSCDETVLIDADEAQRRKYAQLLLKTAGQEQGFTTCLSASATALRYRLKNTMKPRQLHSGAVTVALVSFLLLITCGGIALAYDTGTGKDSIFFGQEPETYTLTSVQSMDRGSHHEYVCVDPEGLKDYLCQVTTQKLTGNYDFSDDFPSLVLLFDTPKGTLGLDLDRETVGLTKFWGEKISQERVYIPGGLDWDRLNRLIPELPTVELCLKGPGNTDLSYASLDSVTQVFDDRSEVIKAPMPPEETGCGIYGNIDFDTLELRFPQPPVTPVRVTMAGWSGTILEDLTLEAPDQVMELPSNDLRLTISASFSGPGDSVYEAVFRFELRSEHG